MIFASDELGQQFKMVFNESFLLRDIDDSLEIFIQSSKPEVAFKLKVSFYDEGEPKKDQCWYDEKENSCLLIIHNGYEQTEQELSRLSIYDIPGRRLFIRTSRVTRMPKMFMVTAWATIYVGDNF